MPNDGVGASRIHLPPGPWKSLLDFLHERFPQIDHEIWRQRLLQHKVRDADGAPLSVDAAFVAGQVVQYFRELPCEPTIPFEAQILYHDAHLLVADKPHFLATMPAGRFVQQSLLVRLKNETRLDQLAPLHRLDRATAGVVLLSVDETTRHAYSALFAERRVEKTYEALAATQALLSFPLTRRSRIAAGEPFFRMRETDGEPNAQTQIDVIENRGDISLYRLAPLTGKKHQLRVHMAALGMAIINDRWYPLLQDESEDDYSRPLKLLARRLVFTDPLTGEPRVFESRLSL
jgi:tRNA pseudouridine32 synthase/23S rRNA pseudouridine746 synthase